MWPRLLLECLWTSLPSSLMYIRIQSRPDSDTSARWTVVVEWWSVSPVRIQRYAAAINLGLALVCRNASHFERDQVRPGEVAQFNECYLHELFCTEFLSFYTPNKVEKLERRSWQATCSVLRQGQSQLRNTRTSDQTGLTRRAEERRDCPPAPPTAPPCQELGGKTLDTRQAKPQLSIWYNLVENFYVLWHQSFK